MDLWDKSLQRDDRDHQRRRFRRENPSFSSSLLDAIYRSIDESNGQGDEQLILYRETTRTKQSISAARLTEDDEALKFRRACMIEKWMEKKKVRNIRNFTTSNSNSSSSSFESGRFSSSEAEFFSRPKPIKTREIIPIPIPNPNPSPNTNPNPHKNGSFVKPKSKASKFYHDLKKVKHPISPGARLANFLNSLFNGGTPKTKPKLSNSSSNSNTTYDYDMSTKSKSAQGSTCSSTSSFSRSCLSSKTPSSRGNTKRSVRFCPVSVILDEDCQPLGAKNLHKLEQPIMKKALKTEKVKAELLENCRRQMKMNSGNEGSDSEEDDDAVSCSSSDLFELDNLSVIGIERYREELPVYETTHFKTNCAIANGLVL